MKKKIIFYVCISLLMASIAVAVFLIIKSTREQYETGETKAFKEVLTLLENNREKSNKKGYEIKFKEDFNYAQKLDDNEQITDYTAHYVSDGVFLLSCEASDAKNLTFEGGFESFFKNANGFMSGNQVECHEIHNVETEKSSNKEIRKEDINRGTSNKFIIDADSNISVMSETTYLDLSNPKNDVKDSFNGKIARSVLYDSVESKSFSNAVDKMLFVDAWDQTNTLLTLMHKTFKEMVSSNYENLYNYIKNKSFSYERKDKSIVIKYKLSLDSSLKEEANDFNDAEIEIEVDNNTGEILIFKFYLSKYLSSLLALYAGGAVSFNADVKSYYIEGKIINNTLTREDTSSVSYTEYNADNKYDFVDKFMNHALPTREDIYSN